MAKISPFRAVRPNKVYVESVASFPYDVVSSDEARIIAADNPLSFLHISKAEIDFPDNVTFSDPAVYEKAKLNLRLFQDREILIQDARPLFYIYSQKMGEHRQYGIVATVHVSEFESGQVKRHELTLPEKQEDRTRHFETLCAQTGPIFLAYRANEEINRIVEEVVSEDDPEYDFTMSDGIQHTVWIISGAQQISAITKLFGRIDSLYIADGHHRAASAVEVARRLRNSNKNHAGNEEYNSILSVLFPHDQLKIMDYNRAVVDLNGLSKTDFMKNISESFDVEEDFKKKSPQSLHNFGMYLDRKWYRLIAKPACFETKDIIGSLDVSILQNCLLKPILGIGDPRQDKRIKFIGGIRGMAELEKIVDSGDYAVAFSMYPPTLDQMFQVADAGEIMPPKSTWFEPKLRSGLFVHLLDQ